MNKTIWLNWEDLTQVEQEQAEQSYAFIRANEEETTIDNIDTTFVKTCQFERQKDGYIYVNI